LITGRGDCARRVSLVVRGTGHFRDVLALELAAVALRGRWIPFRVFQRWIHMWGAGRHPKEERPRPAGRTGDHTRADPGEDVSLVAPLPGRNCFDLAVAVDLVIEN
jgi:hypothetical protein